MQIILDLNALESTHLGGDGFGEAMAPCTSSIMSLVFATEYPPYELEDFLGYRDTYDDDGSFANGGGRGSADSYGPTHRDGTGIGAFRFLVGNMIHDADIKVAWY